MPVRTRSSHVVMISENKEETHLKITLELDLNINLNNNGIQATISAKTDEEEDEGFGGFVVPDFGPTKNAIKIGKKVTQEESKTVCPDQEINLNQL